MYIFLKILLLLYSPILLMASEETDLIDATVPNINQPSRVESCQLKVMTSNQETRERFDTKEHFDTYLARLNSYFAEPISADDYVKSLIGEKETRHTPKKNLDKCEKFILYTEGLRSLGEYSDVYKEKKSELELFKGTLEIIIFDSSIATKSSCYEDCKINFAFNSAKNCFKECSIVENEFTRDLFVSEKGDPDYIDYKKCKKLSDSEKSTLKNNYELTVSDIRKRKRPLLEFIRGRISLYKSMGNIKSSSLEKIQKLIGKNKSAECIKKNEVRESAVRSATKHLSGEDFRGTGFFVNSSGEKVFITAKHVGTDESGKYNFSGFNPLTYTNNGEKEAVTFEMKPGMFDSGRDILVKRADSSVDALNIISSTETLQIGQRVIIHGFPGSRNGQWTTYSCNFNGYYNASSDSSYTESNYLLHCPGVTRSVGGVSGGPTTTEDGKVIGVNRAEIQDDNYVVVSPISQVDGKLKLGLQENRVVDDCYKPVAGDVIKYRCHIFPSNNNIPF